ncbi:MAG: apolipoprotein N-acyltransferase [Polyangiaceae bacterium]
MTRKQRADDAPDERDDDEPEADPNVTGVAEDEVPGADDEPSDDEPSDEWRPPQLSIPKTWALATLSAVLCPLGFAGFDYWPLAFVAWVPLILAIRGQTPKRAALLGWYAGFAMTMIGFYWLVEMLEVFSGFPLPVCVLFAAILCAQKGGRIALCTWLYARASRRGWHPGLSFLGAFAVSELIYPLLFPWYYAASMHTVPVMMQTADIGGVIFVSVVILACNVALAELLLKPVFKAEPDRRMVIGGLAAPLLALAYGAFRLSSVDAEVAAAESIQVGIVQGNSPLKGRKDALRKHIAMTKELAPEVDLVVWSEAAASRSFDVNRYERLTKQRITRTLGVPTIVGLVVYERLKREPGAKGRIARYFNTALMADEVGDIKGRYDKQFLLMFGEYLPFGDQFPVLYEWSPNSGSFSPGTSFQPLPFGDRRIATMICYEDIIPSFVNKLVDEGTPHLFVNMTNDAWFGDTIEPWQHLALAKFRSVEHRRYMIRATNSGVSAIIDPLGRTPQVGGTFTEQTLKGKVAFLEGTTIYGKVGDIPWWIVTGVMVLAAFVRRREPGERAF